ncbi:KpsF/GutQ family sugar-phosphate isomerase [Amylibacter sp. SFDW26]|uniref:KpsF/GutQ family sugar-phosphate isomerase n=1 Tax=Amylibacter sp. SFDW26 TaxID=2652722 RepID=UPI0012623362|nr:KpsF/GutQ family sugar-phosphate isomerase [Amylibacter sp. SFDW26]KAB7610087.1 KpsF/GutQ family sugar-phosphate isomerase [Amylibacter sp. SFDW26]
MTDKLSNIGAEVLKIEADALVALADSLDVEFEQAVKILSAVQGRVVVSGMGKSGHIARKIAATLASTGTPAQFVHPGEASHGDLGMITKSDVCIMLSNSGETAELSDEIAHTRRFSIPMIAITKNPTSSLATAADVALILPDAPEACSIGMAPTTSTTLQLALGDALAVALMNLHGFDRDNYRVNHPGGKLGAQLLKVESIMHSGSALPVVSEQTAMSDALLEMTAKGFGVAAVVKDQTLLGIITDGDLRRSMEGLMDLKAGAVATMGPVTATPDMLASEALGIMNDKTISALMVVDSSGSLKGLLHIHDILRAGVV